MPDAVQLHVFWRDTKRQIDAFAQAVRAGQRLDEAAGFARYVLNSGLCGILAEFPHADPLTCDGHLLRSVAQDLLSAVQERWRTNDLKPTVDFCELQAINRKLDLIAGHVARISPMSPAILLPAIEPGPSPLERGRAAHRHAA